MPIKIHDEVKTRERGVGRVVAILSGTHAVVVLANGADELFPLSHLEVKS